MYNSYPYIVSLTREPFIFYEINTKADHLNPVWLHPILENAIRSNGDTAVFRELLIK